MALPMKPLQPTIEVLESRMLFSSAVLVADLSQAPAPLQGRLLGACSTFALYTQTLDGKQQLWANSRSGAVQLMRSCYVSDTSIVGSLDNVVLFNNFGSNHSQLWRTDGTASGTFRLSDSAMDTPLHIGRRIYFASSNGLWFSDGTPGGTKRFYKSAGCAGLMRGGDRFLFQKEHADGQSIYADLWSTNGTAAGTHEVTKNLSTINYYYPPVSWANGLLFPRTLAGDDGLTFVDGTTGKAHIFVGSDGKATGYATVLGSIDQTMYLWTTSNGSTGVWSLSAPNQSLQPISVTSTSTFGAAQHVGQLQDSVLYVSNAVMHAIHRGGAIEELWGTGGFHDAVVSGDRLFYTNFDVLDVTDGTNLGTHELGRIGGATIAAGGFREAYVEANAEYVASPLNLTTLSYPTLTQPSKPRSLTAVGNALYFTAGDGIHGRELWKTLPTGGATMVADINPGAGDTNINEIVALGDAAYFFATTGTTNSRGYDQYQLYRDDNTGLHQIPLPPNLSLGGGLTAYQGAIYFQSSDDTRTDNYFGIYRVDGTTGALSLVKRLQLGNGSNSIAVSQGKLFMVARTWSTKPFILWRSDGTPGGTVKHLKVEASDLFSTRDRLYFSAVGQLWETSLDPKQSRIVTKPPKGKEGFSGVRQIVAGEGKLYFIGSKNSLGRSLQVYVIDKNMTEPHMVYGPKKTGALASGSVASNLAGSADGAYFVGDGKLWFTDGTAKHTGPASTAPDQLLDLVTASARPYMLATGNDGYARILRYSRGKITDVYSAGFVSAEISTPDPYDAYPLEPRQVASVNGTLYFTADDGLHGEELWRYVPPRKG
jgi:ELWxxDGT repeat protein